MLLTAIKSFLIYFLQNGTFIVWPQIWLSHPLSRPLRVSVYLRVISNELWHRATSLLTHGEELRVRQVCAGRATEWPENAGIVCFDDFWVWTAPVGIINLSKRQFGRLPSRKRLFEDRPLEKLWKWIWIFCKYQYDVLIRLGQCISWGQECLLLGLSEHIFQCVRIIMVTFRADACSYEKRSLVLRPVSCPAFIISKKFITTFKDS